MSEIQLAIEYDDKIVRIRKIRYDYKMKCNVIVLDSGNAEVLRLENWKNDIFEIKE